LRPWIKRFTMIISAWWLRTSSKFSGKKSKNNRKTRKWTTPKRVRIRPNYSAIVAFSKDKDEQWNRRIKMEQSINH